MSTREKRSFFDLGTQYYVVARFSAFAALTPACGNHFHHAIEMYLKGYLSSKLRMTELKDLGHRLGKIWNRFKVDISDVQLNPFDQVISELDKFESIRYPERILSNGMMALISSKRQPHARGSLKSRRPEPVYEVVVEEIDHLVQMIFERASVDFKFFTNSLNPQAKAYLSKESEASLV